MSECKAGALRSMSSSVNPTGISLPSWLKNSLDFFSQIYAILNQSFYIGILSMIKKDLTHTEEHRVIHAESP